MHCREVTNAADRHERANTQLRHAGLSQGREKVHAYTRGRGRGWFQVDRY